MSDKKTDAEFIAECEAGLAAFPCVVTFPEFTEALERLKHGDKELKMLTNEAYAHALIVGEQFKQIAELKALLGKVRHEIQDPLNECCTSYVGNRQCSNCERRIKLLAEIDGMV